MPSYIKEPRAQVKKKTCRSVRLVDVSGAALVVEETPGRLYLRFVIIDGGREVAAVEIDAEQWAYLRGYECALEVDYPPEPEAPPEGTPTPAPVDRQPPPARSYDNGDEL
jgi:hypothetical protein